MLSASSITTAGDTGISWIFIPLRILAFLVSIGMTEAAIHAVTRRQVDAFVRLASAIANNKDFTGKTAVVINDPSGDIILEEVIHGGEPRVQISRCVNGFLEECLLCEPITSIAQLQQDIRGDMGAFAHDYEKYGVAYHELSDDVQLKDLDPENIEKTEEATGGAISHTQKITYKSGQIVFAKFPPGHDKPVEVGQAGIAVGIPRQNSRFAARSMWTFTMARVLGFDVIPQTFSIRNRQGAEGYAQKMVHGESGHRVFADIWHNSASFEEAVSKVSEVTLQSNIVRKIVELAYLDALTGQADRHGENFYLNLQKGEVFGIDNDVCGGKLTSSPYHLLPYRKPPDEPLNEHEQEIMEHCALTPIEFGSILITDLVQSTHGVMLPPVMDTHMVATFKSLTDATLRGHMTGFTEAEKTAACARLEAIHLYITQLESEQQRNQPKINELDERIADLRKQPHTGKQKIRLRRLRDKKFWLTSVIQPHQWAEPGVSAKLFSDNRGSNKENNYLQRQMRSAMFSGLRRLYE